MEATGPRAKLSAFIYAYTHTHAHTYTNTYIQQLRGGDASMEATGPHAKLNVALAQMIDEFSLVHFAPLSIKVCDSTHTHIHTHTHTNIHTYIHTYIHTCTYMCVYTFRSLEY